MKIYVAVVEALEQEKERQGETQKTINFDEFSEFHPVFLF